MQALPKTSSESEVISPSGSPRILVVDDDPSIVNLLREALSMEGYEILCGFDGQMAVQMARKYLPDLIVMDVAMPMTNGLKAFQFLRAGEDTRLIPVIFVSGELSKDVYPIVEQGSRVAHLKKPMDLEHLSSMVRQFIRQYPVVH